ncbi:MAG: hypothetical protein RLZZ623_88 [Actinomycetota bacterium]|jgi:hypothetical protein
MGKIVLLAVAAAWAAVLLPPLLRSRMDNRPGSSVTDFRRQLSTLQRAVPTRSMTPMRSMARPLAPSPLQRPAAAGRPNVARAHGASIAERESYTGELQRRHDRDQMVHGQRHQPGRRVSQREVVRRRRTNVVFVLALANVVTLFLAGTTKSSAMVYAFALAFVSLCGYCYKLAQLRQYEQDRLYSDANWFNAA